MKKIAFILLVLMMIAAGASGQILKGAGIIYFDSLTNVNASTSGAEIAFSIKQKALYKWNRTTSEWDLVVKDTSAFNELQVLYKVDDTLYLTDQITGVSLKEYKNRLHLIATLADTTSITDEVEGDVAYVTGGDTLAFRDSLYWLPFFVEAYTDPDPDPTNELQEIDTLTLSGTILNASLSNDGVAAKTVNLSGLLTGYVSGSLTAGRIPRATAATTIADGTLRDDGTLLAIGGATVSGYSFYDYNTGGWRLPVGAAAQRPTGQEGGIRYNSQQNNIEYYAVSAWEAPIKSSTSTGLLSTGSVFFADAAGRAGQDNANLFWNNTLKRLGIGTASPGIALEVVTTTSDAGIFNTGYGTNVFPGIVGRHARGTLGSPAALQAGDYLIFFGGRGHDGTSFPNVSQGYVGVIANQTFTATAKGAYMIFATTPDGSTSASEKMRITGSGRVGIAETNPARTLHVTGEARITDLTTDTPTRIVGADADGDLSADAPGFGLAYTGGVLQVDSTKIATQSDLASVSVTTLYTGDGTIATDRTVTINDGYGLILTGSPGVLSFTETSGYIGSLSSYGFYKEIADTAFYLTEAAIKQPSSSTVFQVVAGRQDASTMATLEVNGDGGTSVSSLKASGESGVVLDGSTATYTADVSHINKIGSTTIHTTTATGLGINDTSPEKSLDVGGMGKFRQLSGQDNSVTIGTNANMGTGRSASITDAHSSDVAGRISFTSGTTLTAGEWVTLTWGTSFDHAPAVQLFPENANAASVVPYLYVVPSTTGCSIVVNVTGGAYEALTFEFNYITIQGK